MQLNPDCFCVRKWLLCIAQNKTWIQEWLFTFLVQAPGLIDKDSSAHLIPKQRFSQNVITCSSFEMTSKILCRHCLSKLSFNLAAFWPTFHNPIDSQATILCKNCEQQLTLAFQSFDYVPLNGFNVVFNNSF